MGEMQQRSLLERLVGRPLPWVAWAWLVLAVVWVVFAIVEPSGFHTTMAISWTVLAAVQFCALWFGRRPRRTQPRDGDDGTTVR
ncbi:hypothetical protein [Curtobacterium sp. 9128]|uniref:hypothetical protein n=1 Tax=Curtobacterium sp. 9128 TaxID=1793722 RepID=UPI0011A922AD|nr:hypothetical protein [Curtobacterium sp. 9128]